MLKSRNLFKPFERTTILDPVLFRKKIDFFYDTSFDILFKGEFREESNPLRVFVESLKASTNVSLNKPLSKPKQKFTPWKTYKFPVKKSNPIHLAVSPKQEKKYFSLISTQSLHHKTFTKFPFKKSQSQKIIEPNHVLQYSKTIRDLDKIIDHLDKAIQKEKRKEYFTVLKGSFNDEREKIISLFIDYLDPEMFQKINYRYNDLFGKDTYFKHIKILKKAQMATAKQSRNKTHEQENTQYINMLNDIPFANKQFVNSKYSSLGKVRVLNLPREFSEQEIDTDKLLNRKNIVIDNVKTIYDVNTKRTQRHLDYCAKLSKGYRKSIKLKTKELTRINNQSDDLAKNTDLIKKNLMNMKTSFNCKSPLLNKKLFAYIEEEEEIEKKTKRK